MKFGEKLRQEREARGLTRESLAASSGVPFGTIHGYEIGRRAPSFANVVKLAAALGLDCTMFAGCEDVGGQAEEPAPKKRGKK
jgi:transcriptional regulator with XRE-family HTH domain